MDWSRSRQSWRPLCAIDDGTKVEFFISGMTEPRSSDLEVDLGSSAPTSDYRVRSGQRSSPSRRASAVYGFWRHGLGLARLLMGGVLVTILSAAEPNFVSDVRPILEAHCFKCHGPEKQKSGYRLDVKSIA